MENNKQVGYELTSDKTGFILKIPYSNFELTETALIRIKNSIIELEKNDLLELKGIKVTPELTRKQELMEDFNEALKIFVKDSIKFTRESTTPFGGTETIVHKGKGLEEQFVHILKVYNDNLEHQNTKDVKIINWSFGSGEFID